jgi:hypothetical protein
LTNAVITRASVVLVVDVEAKVDDVEDVVEVVVVEVVSTVVGGVVVVAIVAGATVLGATVVGATVVGAIVVGAEVVGAIVVGATVMGIVVVGTTLRLAIAVADETFDCDPIPNCPKSLSPQQRTSPVDITAHAWLVPVVTSITVPVRPVTTAAVSRTEPEAPEPNWPLALSPKQ